MSTILIKEFSSLFKNIKSIIIVLMFLGITKSMSKFASVDAGIIKDNMNLSNNYVGGIALLLFVLGFLFILMLSHDVVNREVENGTIRLLVTKVPRKEIVLGKFFGVLLFWVSVITLCFVIITFSAGTIFGGKYFQIIGFITFACSLCVLISTLVRRNSYSVFVALIAGIGMPILGTVSLLSKGAISYLKYILPYYYLVDNLELSFIPYLISIIIVSISLIVFEGRDL